MLDSDLAELYQVETKPVNEHFKRNRSACGGRLTLCFNLQKMSGKSLSRILRPQDGVVEEPCPMYSQNMAF
jgi:hypothetical protein